MRRIPQGRTALHIACAVKPGGDKLGEPNGIDTVTVLIEAGADLERAVPMAEEEGGFRATPLWYAVARGENLPLVQYLLQRGADASYLLVGRSMARRCRVVPRAVEIQSAAQSPGARRNADLRSGPAQAPKGPRSADRRRCGSDRSRIRKAATPWRSPARAACRKKSSTD